jgi:hypothetical protein
MSDSLVSFVEHGEMYWMSNGGGETLLHTFKWRNADYKTSHPINNARRCQHGTPCVKDKLILSY